MPMKYMVTSPPNKQQLYAFRYSWFFFYFYVLKKILLILNLRFKSKLGNMLDILKGIKNNIMTICVSTTQLKKQNITDTPCTLSRHSPPPSLQKVASIQICAFNFQTFKIFIALMYIHLKMQYCAVSFRNLYFEISSL